MKTTYRFDWESGYIKVRRLSRSFKTLEEAQAFSNNKCNAEIYKSKGMYKVDYVKSIDNND